MEIFQVNIEKLFENVEMSGKEKCCGLLRVFISLFQHIGALFMPGIRGEYKNFRSVKKDSLNVVF